jgi:hypothetical protein
MIPRYATLLYSLLYSTLLELERDCLQRVERDDVREVAVAPHNRQAIPPLKVQLLQRHILLRCVWPQSLAELRHGDVVLVGGRRREVAQLQHAARAGDLHGRRLRSHRNGNGDRKKSE